MDNASVKRFPTNPKDYKLYEEIGEGVSATVYRALCIPFNETVAIKVLDLEKCNNDLDGIRREVQIMTLINHPNVVRAHCSFAADHNLWVVMPFMAGGSALHIMKTCYPEGFEERVIATLLREVLKALVYLHCHGHIHRDVKAGNILLDSKGAVKLADFGVSACMFETGDRQQSRNTFVGTPCWMAPEVMQQLHGYDFKADIWSFGITALELAHGHAPFSKYPPMKVLLMTLQNAPPGLDYERDKRFSKSFKDMVATCLVKDPKKRPSSEKLLKHSFFKHACTGEYLVRNILDGLPSLGERFRALKAKEANLLLNNKISSEEQLSQKEYIRGISAWDFNMEDLKAQAALLGSGSTLFPEAMLDKTEVKESSCVQQEKCSEKGNGIGSVIPGKELKVVQDLDAPFASAFQSQPLEALKFCFDLGADDTGGDVGGDDDDDYDDDDDDNGDDNNRHSSSPHLHQEPLLNSTFPVEQTALPDDNKTAGSNPESMKRNASSPSIVNIAGSRKFSSGSLIPEHVLSPNLNNYSEASGHISRNNLQHRFQHGMNNSGPLAFPRLKDAYDYPLTLQEADAELSERKVQRKGRFKITSGLVSPKATPPPTNGKQNPLSGATSGPALDATTLLLQLQFLLQQNALQKETLDKLIACAEKAPGLLPTQHQNGDTANSSQGLQPSGSDSRVRQLHTYITSLEQSISKLGEELQRLQEENSRMEQKIADARKG